MLKKLLKNNLLFLFCLMLLIVFRSSIADWSYVPSGSMEPTIEVGDVLLINKMAYDIRIPFTHISLFNVDDPKRGDIVIFDSEKKDLRMVKRIIGVPNDVIAMENNRLIINNRVAQYKPIKLQNDHLIIEETFTNNDHQLRINKQGTPFYSNFQPITIPDDYYLVLGDNRNNSSDSRVIGLIPRHEIVGKSNRVLVSLNQNNYYLPKTERFIKAI